MAPLAQFPLQVPAHRQHRARQEIAESLGIRHRDLQLSPAFGGVSDFADLGVLLRNVVVARSLVPRDGGSFRSGLVCILDLRPILLGFDWVLCPDGIFLPDRLIARFAGRCPPGCCIGRIVSGSGFSPLQDPFLIQDGDVITLAFRGTHIETAEVGSGPPDAPPRTSGWGGEDDEPWRPTSGWPAFSGSDTAPTPGSTATEHWGTGGTYSSHTSGTGAKLEGIPVSSVMWSNCILWRRLLDDNSYLTPGIPGLPLTWHTWVRRLGDHVFLAAVFLCIGLGRIVLSVACDIFRLPRHFWLFCFIALACQGACAVQASGVEYPSESPAEADRVCVRVSSHCDRSREAAVRPVPTPCRNLRTAEHTSTQKYTDHGGADLECLHPLQTLLEQSEEVISGHVFFLASTLVETLLEHFEPPRSDPPFPIFLEDHLPRWVQYDLSRVTLGIGKTFDDVAQFLQGCWPLPHALPDGLRLHQATVRALATDNCPAVSDSIRTEIYTDGSFNGRISAWAFAVVDLTPSHRTLKGWCRGTVASQGEPAYIGAQGHSALEAERTALFWALTWALAHADGRTRVWTDSLAVVGQTSGKWGGTAPSLLARACRAIAHAAEAARDVCFSAFQHVRAHQGDPFNELVDVLAKGHWIPDTPIPAPYSSLPDWVRNGSIEWMWLICEATRNPDQWPALQGSTLVDTLSELKPTQLAPDRALGLRSSVTGTDTNLADKLSLKISLVSANVQTLEEDKTKGLVGRVPYVREQLEWVGVCITGLQETRAKTTETIVSATHFRFTSAANSQGCLGVELWVSRTVPFAYQHGRPLFFSVEDFRVLSWSPRHLFAKCIRGGLRFLIVVCHAPTATDPLRNSWWRQFAVDLRGYAGNLPVVILGDLNLRLIEPWGDSVGDLCWEDGDSPPSPFFRLLTHHELWIPSTFTACHRGLSHTWVSPGQGALSRIDYVIVPQAWGVDSGSSRVLYDVDFGQVGLDHYSVYLETSALLHASCSKGRRPPRIDVSCLHSPGNAGIVKAICQTTPAIPWSVDAHTHYDLFARHLVDNLALAFPAKQATKRKTFFSESTWSFRQQRVSLRKIAHRASAWIANYEARIAWVAWHCDGPLHWAGLLSLADLLRSIADLHRSVGDLRSLKPLLRRSIQGDKRSFTHEAARAAATCTSKDTFRKLRTLIGPPKHKVKGSRAIPAIKLEDGSIAEDLAEAEARWIRHFSSIEAGAPQTPDCIIAQCCARQGARDLADYDIEAEDLLTRGQVEDGLRASTPGKAAGKDRVPADLLRVCPSGLSRSLYSIVLKFAMHLQEPIQWKGGDLHAVWKRKGSPLACESYRAILVSSSVGKAVHGALRRQCSRYFENTAQPLQVGGRAGFPVQFVLQAARLWQERCKAKRVSCAIIFLDLKEAFHRVARALVHGGKPDEASIQNVIATLGLDSDVGPRLQAYVRDHSLISTAGGPIALSSMVAETNCDTWFAHGVLEGTAVVNAGTRPGDNLADLIFSFLFAELLKVLRQRFARDGLSCALPWNEQWLGAGPEATTTSSSADVARPIDVTWMDDLALLVEDSQPEGLLDKVAAVATATLDECMKATLAPNLTEGKTECVVALYGPGSRKTAATIFRGSSPDLPLYSSIWPDARLRLVSTYKHVGGLVQAGGGTGKEVRSRIGSAWAAFRQHRRQVFSSPLVQARDKAVLFSAVVESTMFYGVGAWPAYDEAATLKFQGALMNMARLMLRPRFSYMQARHVVSKGCAEFWALLHAEQSWLRQMQHTLGWAGTLRGRAGLTDPDVSDWTTAADIARTEAGRWKRIVKQTKVIAGLDSLWTAEVQQYHGLLFRQLRLAGAYLDELVAEAASPEICAPCGQVFPDKRSWSHHAFKVHGRVREERQLVTGQQCPVCLRHYRSTEKLCNHVRYSSVCKSALICAGAVVAPTPGIGSKKFLDGSKSQLPAVQAQGPTQQWQPGRPLFEEHRPSEEVLAALEDLFCHDGDSCHSYQDVLDAYRKAFSCCCLQLSRLRATALEWQKRLQDALSSDEEWSVQWSGWHNKAADLIQRVSWPDWLVPDPAAPKFAVSTFKDASTQLPWLLFDHVHLPLPRATGQIGFVVAEKDPGFGRFLSHHAASASPDCLDVDKWTGQSVANSVTLFSCLGLLASLTLLGPFRSYREVEPRLHSLRLLSDLVRGTLRLWTQGHPCVLIAHTLICPGLAALGKVAPFSASAGDRTVLGNVPCTDFLSLFP